MSCYNMIHSTVTGKWLKLVLLLSRRLPRTGSWLGRSLEWLNPFDKETTHLTENIHSWTFCLILLMEEIPNNHLRNKTPRKQWDKLPTSTGLKGFFHQQYDGCEAFIEAVLPGDVSPGAVQAALYAQGLRYHSNLGRKLKRIKWWNVLEKISKFWLPKNYSKLFTLPTLGSHFLDLNIFLRALFVGKSAEVPNNVAVVWRPCQHQSRSCGAWRENSAI